MNPISISENISRPRWLMRLGVAFAAAAAAISVTAFNASPAEAAVTGGCVQTGVGWIEWVQECNYEGDYTEGGNHLYKRIYLKQTCSWSQGCFVMSGRIDVWYDRGGWVHWYTLYSNGAGWYA
jgi:hypothetical protein